MVNGVRFVAISSYAFPNNMKEKSVYERRPAPIFKRSSWEYRTLGKQLSKRVTVGKLIFLEISEETPVMKGC